MLIWAVAAPVTETDKPPLVHPEKVIVAALLVYIVLSVALVTLVNDNPLGVPQALVLAARNSQFVPLHISTLLRVVL
jgi:hypothetical protein